MIYYHFDNNFIVFTNFTNFLSLKLRYILKQLRCWSQIIFFENYRVKTVSVDFYVNEKVNRSFLFRKLEKINSFESSKTFQWRLRRVQWFHNGKSFLFIGSTPPPKKKLFVLRTWLDEFFCLSSYSFMFSFNFIHLTFFELYYLH